MLTGSVDGGGGANDLSFQGHRDSATYRATGKAAGVATLDGVSFSFQDVPWTSGGTVDLTFAGTDGNDYLLLDQDSGQMRLRIFNLANALSQLGQVLSGNFSAATQLIDDLLVGHLFSAPTQGLKISGGKGWDVFEIADDVLMPGKEFQAFAEVILVEDGVTVDTTDGTNPAGDITFTATDAQVETPLSVLIAQIATFAGLPELTAISDLITELVPSNDLNDVPLVPEIFVSTALSKIHLGTGSAVRGGAVSLKASSVAAPSGPLGVGATPGAGSGTLAAETYFYRVSAIVGAGAKETIAAPEIKAVVGGSNNQVVLSWTAVPEATEYRIYRAIGSDPFNGYYKVTAPTVTFTDTGAAFTESSGAPLDQQAKIVAVAISTVEGADTELASKAALTVSSSSAIVAEARHEAPSSATNPAADAALAVVLALGIATTDLTGGPSIEADGALIVTATNSIHATATADAQKADGGSAVALAGALPITRASIQGGGGEVEAQSLDLSADSNTVVRSDTNASPGGATINPRIAPARTGGGAATSQGPVNNAAALSFTGLYGTSSAFLSGSSTDDASATATGDLKIRSSARNRSSATADASNVDPSTDGRIGVAIAVQAAKFTNLAYIADASFVAPKVVVEARAPAASDFAATSTSGIGDSSSSNLSFAGSLAVNVALTDTTAALRGTVGTASGNDIEVSASSNATASAKALIARQVFDPNKAINTTDNTLSLPYKLRKIDSGSVRNLQTGDAVVYRKGEGTNIGGLTDGTTYYAIVDSSDPKKLKLAASSADATAGTAINLSSPGTGNEHSIVVETDPGPGTGIGASIAFNVVNDTTTAEVAQNATVTGAEDLKLKATTKYMITTEAENGASGGTAFVGSAAVTIANLKTKAQVAPGATVTLTGKLEVETDQQGATKTAATGESEGSKNAWGIALAVSAATYEASALLQGNTSATGAISVTAAGSSTNETTSTAIAAGTGGQGSGAQSPNSAANAHLARGNAHATTRGGTGAASNTTQTAGTADGTISVAAAITFAIIKALVLVSLGAGLVVASGGALKLLALGDTDSKATADGSATDSATGIGAAVAFNDVEITTEAIIGTGATVTSIGLLLGAAMRGPPGDLVHTLEASATSGAGASNIGFAGALAINVITVNTRALILSGSTVTAGTGDVQLIASHAEKSSAKAKAMAVGDKFGVGASIAVNKYNPTVTRAEIQDGSP